MRYGFDGLAAQVAQVLEADPFSGHLSLFRSKRADYLKCLYWGGTGLCLFAKRLEAGKFVWPPIVMARWCGRRRSSACWLRRWTGGGRWRPRRRARPWRSDPMRIARKAVR